MEQALGTDAEVISRIMWLVFSRRSEISKLLSRIGHCCSPDLVHLLERKRTNDQIAPRMEHAVVLFMLKLY
jgi:hypothetical protein